MVVTLGEETHIFSYLLAFLVKPPVCLLLVPVAGEAATIAGSISGKSRIFSFIVGAGGIAFDVLWTTKKLKQV